MKCNGCCQEVAETSTCYLDGVEIQLCDKCACVDYCPGCGHFYAGESHFDLTGWCSNCYEENVEEHDYENDPENYDDGWVDPFYGD